MKIKAKIKKVYNLALSDTITVKECKKETFKGLNYWTGTLDTKCVTLVTLAPSTGFRHVLDNLFGEMEVEGRVESVLVVSENLYRAIKE